MHRAVAVPNSDVRPTELVALATDLEAAGWDGLFLYDHLQVHPSLRLETYNPWVLLGAVAQATDRLRLGTAVTPIARRRPWNLAKELVTLDHLSNGRAVAGIGLGGMRDHEFGAFGDPTALGELARIADEALELLDAFLRGVPVEHAGDHHDVHARLLPAAVQDPRPPIWTAATYPHQLPLERAARWDGVFCNAKIEDDSSPLRPEEVAGYVGSLLASPDHDVVTFRHPDHDAHEYDELGVSWLVELTTRLEDWLPDVRSSCL